MAQFSELIDNDSLNQLKSFIDEETDPKKFEESYAKGLAKDLAKTFGSDTVKVNGTDISVAYKILDSEDEQLTFFDLKPYFERSAHAKVTKDGGWYLRVPIGNRASEFRRAYGRKQFDIISHIQFGQTAGENANRERFQKILSNAGGLMSSPLAYQWKSTSVTRVLYGNGLRGQYISFRTVSNKSDPNSWIISRNSLQDSINNHTNTEEEAKAVAEVISSAIDRVMNNYKGSEGN